MDAFTPNKIENNREIKKYEWQKPHQSNLTGTKNAYYPNKNKDVNNKNIKAGKNKLLIVFIFNFFLIFTLSNKTEFIGKNTDLKILDKISSK